MPPPETGVYRWAGAREGNHRRDPPALQHEPDQHCLRTDPHLGGPHARRLVSPGLGTNARHTPGRTGMRGREQDLLKQLGREPVYQRLPAAFPQSASPFRIGNVTMALAAVQFLELLPPQHRRGRRSRAARNGQEQRRTVHAPGGPSQPLAKLDHRRSPLPTAAERKPRPTKSLNTLSYSPTTGTSKHSRHPMFYPQEFHSRLPLPPSKQGK